MTYEGHSVTFRNNTTLNITFVSFAATAAQRTGAWLNLG